MCSGGGKGRLGGGWGAERTAVVLCRSRAALCRFFRAPVVFVQSTMGEEEEMVSKKILIWGVLNGHVWQPHDMTDTEGCISALCTRSSGHSMPLWQKTFGNLGAFLSFLQSTCLVGVPKDIPALRVKMLRVTRIRDRTSSARRPYFSLAKRSRQRRKPSPPTASQRKSGRRSIIRRAFAIVAAGNEGAETRLAGMTELSGRAQSRVVKNLRPRGENGGVPSLDGIFVPKIHHVGFNRDLNKARALKEALDIVEVEVVVGRSPPRKEFVLRPHGSPGPGVLKGLCVHLIDALRLLGLEICTSVSEATKTLGLIIWTDGFRSKHHRLVGLISLLDPSRDVFPHFRSCYALW